MNQNETRLSVYDLFIFVLGIIGNQNEIKKKVLNFLKCGWGVGCMYNIL